eukprot:553172_1
MADLKDDYKSSTDPHSQGLYLWTVLKTTSSIIFGSISIGNCIYEAFQKNQWFSIDYVLDNLIQFKQNNYNIIDIIVNNIKNDTQISDTWNDKKHNNILYQLLLTIYKDNIIHIPTILNEFIATLQTDEFNFNDCNTRQLIQILITDVVSKLPSDTN